jgi:hypothetical protein
MNTPLCGTRTHHLGGPVAFWPCAWLNVGYVREAGEGGPLQLTAGPVVPRAKGGSQRCWGGHAGGAWKLCCCGVCLRNQ